jgi:hypothetical protein
MLAVMGAAVFVLAACGGGSDKASGTDVFLESATSAGSDAFTASVAIGNVEPTVTTGAPPATAAGGAIPTASGATFGLYGGTRGKSSCDRQKLSSSLDGSPDTASAWATVLGFPSDQLDQYVAGVTPAVLIRDTRVTEHGFANGRATARAVVLQAGTAVLVDALGVPRVKCGSGNPLSPAQPVAAPSYTGDTWSGFSPSTTVEVTNAAQPLGVLVLVDIHSGATFGRPIGSDGSGDVDVNEQGQVVAPPPTVINDTTVSGTYTVQYQGNLSGPCQDWPKGKGSMAVSAAGGALTITITYPNGSSFSYTGSYSKDGHWVAPDVQLGRNPIGGTFTIANGTVTVPDGLRQVQTPQGPVCVGGFTATKKV